MRQNFSLHETNRDDEPIGVGSDRAFGCVANRLLLKVGGAVAGLVNPIVLVLIYFFVFTPIAFVVRLAGRRPLRLMPDPTAPSYWIECKSRESGPPSMRRQF
jgi:hypothetical protein